VALSLPAIALYMTVLTNLYQTPDEAKAQYPSPESAKGGRFEMETHRGFVSYTIAEEGWDFRLSVLSLLALVAAAIALIFGIVLDSELISWIGIGITSVGLGMLVVALAYTAYASIRLLYPP
jgi:hypothetical protein